MRKREAGQAFILVLILLAVGVLLVVPALRLTGTSLKSSQIVLPRVKALYAADAAQEFILWKLLHDGLAEELMLSGEPEPQAHYDLDVCGALVTVGVYMRAMEGVGGITLAEDDVIKPTKTVEHQFLPDPVPGRDWYDYEYTITLEQLSDNTTQGLDAIYDILPLGFSPSGIYEIGSSKISLDGGSTWQPIPDPQWVPSPGYLKWPEDYNKDTGEGAFSSDPGDAAHYFYGLRDFNVRQVKMIRFRIKGRLDDHKVHCNWIVLKPWNTLSGPQAPITVGSPDNPGECVDDNVIEVTKTSFPEVIPPGVETDIEYSISMTNMYTQARSIETIIDYLPPGFDYSGNVSGCTDMEPISEMVTLNGVEREQLTWTKDQFPGGIDLSIASEQTMTLNFHAVTTKSVSGSYYNEILVCLKETGITNSAFTEAGVTAEDFFGNYSWNTGTVMVPAFDSSANATGVTINANMALILRGITISSWQVD